MDGGKGLFAFGRGFVEGEGHGWMGGRLDEWMSGWVLGFGPCTVKPCTLHPKPSFLRRLTVLQNFSSIALRSKVAGQCRRVEYPVALAISESFELKPAYR